MYSYRESSHSVKNGTNKISKSHYANHYNYSINMTRIVWFWQIYKSKNKQDYARTPCISEFTLSGWRKQCDVSQCNLLGRYVNSRIHSEKVSIEIHFLKQHMANAKDLEVIKKVYMEFGSFTWKTKICLILKIVQIEIFQLGENWKSIF